MYTTKKSINANKNYTLPVDFSNYNNQSAIDTACTNLFNDNIVFMNSVTGLLRDAEAPFKDKPEDEERFNIFIKSARPELKNRIETLKYIQANRSKFFNIENTLKRENVWSIMKYISQNTDDLLYKLPKYLKQDIDLDYAIREAITNDDFSFYKDNLVKQNWDKLIAEAKLTKNLTLQQ